MLCVVAVALLSLAENCGGVSDNYGFRVETADQILLKYREMADEVQVEEWWSIERCFQNPETGLYETIYQAFSSERKAHKKLQAYQKMTRQREKMRAKYQKACEKAGFDDAQWIADQVQDRSKLNCLKDKYFAIKGERRSVYLSARQMSKGLHAKFDKLPGRVFPVS